MMRGEVIEKLQIIQVMRGIAAIGVLLWHASIFIGPYGEGLGGALFYAPSIIGVDLFFLICGFVIYLSSTQRTDVGITTIAPRVFLIKRLARILPLYVFCTVAIFYIEFHSGRQSWELLIRSLTFFPVSNADYPNIFSPSLTPGWTINYEFYFYFLFGLSLLFGKRFWAVLLAWIAIIAFIPYEPGTLPALVAIVTAPLNLLFVAGILIGVLYRSDIRLPKGAVASAAFIMAPLPVLYQYYAQVGIAHGLSGVGASLVFLLLLTVMADKAAPIRCNRILTYLGDISYSIYLTHPIVMWGVMWANERIAWGGSPWQGWACIAFTLLVTIAVSSLTYRYIEMGLSVRLRRWGIERFVQPRPAAIAGEEPAIVASAAGAS